MPGFCPAVQSGIRRGLRDLVRVHSLVARVLCYYMRQTLVNTKNNKTNTGTAQVVHVFLSTESKIKRTQHSSLGNKRIYKWKIKS